VGAMQRQLAAYPYWPGLLLAAFGALLISTFSACPKSATVRDSKVYQTEVAFMGQAAAQQADLLAHFVKTACSCEGGKFTDPKCQKAAKTLLVVRARIPWHQAMMLYNGGITEERPPKTPPEIPDASTLCPGNS